MNEVRPRDRFRRLPARDKMKPTILLIRHGPVAIASEGRFSRDEFLRYLEAYEAAPLRRDASSPPHLETQIRLANTVFTSEARRSLDSLRLLSPECQAIADAVFGEEPHHIVPSLPGRMPLLVWFAMARCAEAAHPSISRRMPQRAEQAAARLIKAAEDGSTALIGHGWFNRAITRALIARGWRKAIAHGGMRNWSYTHFSSPP